MPQGLFTIPTRVYLTTEQRNRLLTLVRKQDISVPDLLTELLVSFLDHLPEHEQEDLAQTATEPRETTDRATEIRRRRAEVRRLRTRAETSGDPPGWLMSYIEDLEREIKRLEGQEG